MKRLQNTKRTKAEIQKFAEKLVELMAHSQKKNKILQEKKNGNN